MRAHYHAGHNISGYLPQSYPATFSTFADAKAYMVDTLDRQGDAIFDAGESDDERAVADYYSEAVEDLNLDNGPEWEAILPTSTSRFDLGCSFWITACDDSDCSDDEDN